MWHITAEENIFHAAVTVSHDQQQHGTLNYAVSRYDGIFAQLCYIA